MKERMKWKKWMKNKNKFSLTFGFGDKLPQKINKNVFKTKLDECVGDIEKEREQTLINDLTDICP